MAEYGFELFNKSRERLGSGLQVTKDWWMKRIAGGNQNFWMGFDKETGIPGSFGMNTIYDDYCNYNTMGISPDVPNNTYPMYGLIYEMNKHYLQECGLKYVLDGARSITEHSNIQPFLEEKFKFRKAYCDIQIFYQPWLGVIVKILFPFRKWIKQPKVAALLRQEAWSRGIDR